jgi:hypothetical protein
MFDYGKNCLLWDFLIVFVCSNLGGQPVKIIAQNNNIISASVPIYFFRPKNDKNNLPVVEHFSYGETLHV